MNVWFSNVEMEKHIVTEENLSDISYIYVDKYNLVNGYGSVYYVLHSEDIEEISKYYLGFTKFDLYYPQIEYGKLNTI